MPTLLRRTRPVVLALPVATALGWRVTMALGWRVTMALGWLAVATLALGCAPARPPAAPAFDRAAVVAVLEAQNAAWNRGDLEGFMDGYWRSDSLTFYGGGEVAHGWQAAHDRYVRRYRSEGREMGILAFDLHSAEPLGDSDALVRGAWHLTLRDGAPHGLFSLVLHRIPGLGWRIVHDHTSVAI